MPKPRNRRRAMNRRMKRRSESWRPSQRWIEVRVEEEDQRHRCVDGREASPADNDDYPTESESRGSINHEYSEGT